jgi:hypothetical protein
MGSGAPRRPDALDPSALTLPDAEAVSAGVRLGDTYPDRIVLHEERRPRALAMYGATRRDART